jgi:hypothetical protein
MDTAAVSRMTGEDATDVYAVIPGWRDEIEANLERADPVDWDANDYFIAPAQLRASGEVDALVHRYPWFAHP